MPWSLGVGAALGAALGAAQGSALGAAVLGAAALGAAGEPSTKSCLGGLTLQKYRAKTTSVRHTEGI